MSYDSECHSPRPFIDNFKSIQSPRILSCYNSPRVIPCSKDAVQKFERSNSSPYPMIDKTCPPNLTTVVSQRLPSSDLELSFLDTTNERHEPRTGPQRTIQSHVGLGYNSNAAENFMKKDTNSLSDPPNTLNKNDDFFLRRENLGKFNHIQPLYEQLNKLSLEKENNPLVKKTEIMKLGGSNQSGKIYHQTTTPNCNTYENKDYCSCHHCVKTRTPYQPYIQYQEKENVPYKKCPCIPDPRVCPHSYNPHHFIPPQTCSCQSEPVQPSNAVDKKSWMLEKYEQSKKIQCSEVQPQSAVKEKREPTVSDLFKIIKLQNEQLQLLQEKVDKFIATSSCKENSNPSIEDYITEKVNVQSDNQHKISIGVMTSFEVVRTSTIINKEVIKQNEAQIQCNRSQISIKEVVSSQPVNINFLEGIRKTNDVNTSVHNSIHDIKDMTKTTAFEDKTFNDLSLYNVHVDNETTPQMSPEQSMYLDVKDYSESDSESDDPASVGWTYYNKVMNRVNGMLQDSDMPSSASALFRNTRQKCLMQIDKTNVSVTKRVTFGETPVEIQKPVLSAPSTDTSLKMNQLAAKYLPISQQVLQGPIKSPTVGTNMSIATRNYMEKHRIIQGTTNPIPQPSRPHQEIPKFLDITVLKQQPKLL
ncbi:unnamed protein product [Leptosia nina]|uniref:Uncharacterized protein n=1 Tax=Leptosia nina TaxID=320188 RepID=A0AAV1JHS6_9NEOP